MRVDDAAKDPISRLKVYCSNINYEHRVSPAKRDTTLAERGLDMAGAAEIFDGATLTVQDDRQDDGETRQITIGFLEDHMVVMIWTQRGTVRCIISLRKANGRKRRAYGSRF